MSPADEYDLIAPSGRCTASAAGALAIMPGSAAIVVASLALWAVVLWPVVQWVTR